MKPSQIHSELVRIAAALKNSKRPDRRLVTAALRKVIAAMNDDFSNMTTKEIGDSLKATLDANGIKVTREGDGVQEQNGFEGRYFITNTGWTIVYAGIDYSDGAFDHGSVLLYDGLGHGVSADDLRSLDDKSIEMLKTNPKASK